ncbi:unnamed protein product, partial [Prorocentrum cordatum]
AKESARPSPTGHGAVLLRFSGSGCFGRGWQRAAAAAAAAERASPEPEEPLWTPDGAGNLTHWCAESRRLFLWQEATGVLYRQEPAGDRAARAALPPPRREA